LSALKSAVESGQADDEHVREYYLLHLRRWIGISLEEIESIDQEIKILREKDCDAGRDWGQEEKGMTEDEMAGWHH